MKVWVCHFCGYMAAASFPDVGSAVATMDPVHCGRTMLAHDLVER